MVQECFSSTTQRQRPLAHSAATVGHSIALLPPHPAAPVVDEAIAYVGGRNTSPPIHSFPKLYLQFAVTVYLYSICTSAKNTNQTARWSAFCITCREGRLQRTEPAELSCRRCSMLSTPESKKPIAKDGLGSIWAIWSGKTVLEFPAPQSDHSTRNTTTMPHKKNPTRIGKRGF